MKFQIFMKYENQIVKIVNQSELITPINECHKNKSKMMIITTTIIMIIQEIITEMARGRNVLQLLYLNE